MSTLAEINEAHEKVKTGADFPKYVQELVSLGVGRYVTYVSDGRIEYFGVNGEVLNSPAKYTPLLVNAKSDVNRFKERMQLHQQGGTDYPTFCQDAAQAGIHSWEVNMNSMTCNYRDTEGNVLLSEQIPH